jgi:hypothetical protein
VRAASHRGSVAWWRSENPSPVSTTHTVLGFPDLIAPDVVYLENMTSDLYVEQEAEVYRYGLAFDRLRGLALTAGKSAEVIATKADNIQ